jgi:hypothetical protein
MTTLITTIANDRSREMRREAAARRRLGRSRKLRSSRREADHHVVEAVAVRRLADRASDRAAVAHLAELDSTEPLNGDVLGAELDGRLVAAISLTTGDTIADPFTHTDQVRPLLEARAEQLRGGASRFGLRRRSAPVASTC